jgi:tetrahedral aminopeptidase
VSAGMLVQPAIFQNFASDGEAFIRRGVETALVAFPTRYTHSPFEMVDEQDLTQCVQLLAAFATSASYQERRSAGPGPARRH